MNFYHLTIILILLSGCGRKNNNFFSFDEKEKEVKINRLTLPSVKGLSIKTKNNSCILTWNHITDKNFIGYNVYVFSRKSFIPKKSINMSPIKSNTIELNPTGCHCFIVKAIFKIEKNFIEGPASKVACEQPLNNLKNPPT